MLQYLVICHVKFCHKRYIESSLYFKTTWWIIKEKSVCKVNRSFWWSMIAFFSGTFLSYVFRCGYIKKWCKFAGFLYKKSDINSLVSKAVYITFCVDGNEVLGQNLLFYFIKSIKNNWYSSGNVDWYFFLSSCCFFF